MKGAWISVKHNLHDRSDSCLTSDAPRVYHADMETQTILDRIAYNLRGSKAGSQVSDVDAAAALKKHPSTVARWLASISSLPVARFLDLCQVYKVDPVEVLSRSIAEARRG